METEFGKKYLPCFHPCWFRRDAYGFNKDSCSSTCCWSKKTNEIEKDKGLGRSRGEFSSKIHALVDALGNPIKFIITGAEVNDITQGSNLIEDLNSMIVKNWWKRLSKQVQLQ
jgi:hypothetical protein